MVTSLYVLLSGMLLTLMGLLDTQIRHISFLRALRLLLAKSENMNIVMYGMVWGFGLAWAIVMDYRLHKTRQQQKSK